MQISVVIPAYDEERALSETLRALARAVAAYRATGLGDAETIVVDNASADRTATVAKAHGATVVREPRRGIAHARNAGAAAARAPWLFFLDADTLVPEDALIAIHGALSDPRCVGGAPATRYDYRKRSLRPLMEARKVWARTFRMTQGVGQFVTATAFRAIGGYDTAMHMAEDTKFNWDLRRYAHSRGSYTSYLAQTTIVPSSRRYDAWPVWRTYVRLNPIATRLFLRSSRFWGRDWRERTIRWPSPPPTPSAPAA